MWPRIAYSHMINAVKSCILAAFVFYISDEFSPESFLVWFPLRYMWLIGDTWKPVLCTCCHFNATFPSLPAASCSLKVSKKWWWLGEWHHRKELFYIIHLVFNLFAVVVQSLWNLRYCRESSTAATTDGADGRKIGDVLLTNMTVLQVGSVLIVQVMFTSRAEIAYWRWYCSQSCLFVGVCVCHRDNSWTVWEDIVVKFLSEQDVVKSSLGRVWKWLLSDALQHVGGDLMSLTLLVAVFLGPRSTLQLRAVSRNALKHWSNILYQYLVVCKVYCV